MTKPTMTKQHIDALVDAYIAKIDIIEHTSKSGQVRRWAILRTITGGYVASRPSCVLSAKNDDQEAGEQLAITNAKNELAKQFLLSEGYTFEEINSLTSEATKPVEAPTEGVEDHEFLTMLENLMRCANQNDNNRVRIDQDGESIGSVTFMRGESGMVLVIQWEGDEDKAMIQIRKHLAGHIV